jgi:hypothetical protein
MPYPRGAIGVVGVRAGHQRAVGVPELVVRDAGAEVVARDRSGSVIESSS